MKPQTIRCDQCDETFASDANSESTLFDQHACPAIADPVDGESFEDFSKRCDVVKAAWLAQKAQPSNTAGI